MNKVIFFRLFAILMFLCTNTLAENRDIVVSYVKEKGCFTEMPLMCVGAGRANEGLRADWQQHLCEIKRMCDFKYIRFHGLLHDDMGVCMYDGMYNEKKILRYNFQYIDKLYDFLLSIGIRPFVELSFMPNALKSGEETVFWWKGNITPPKEYDEFGKLITALIKHWEERYGMEEIQKWYFEVWNEPDLSSFWAGTKDEYYMLYKTTVNAIKKVNPTLKVGGPASAKTDYIKPFIEYCKKENLPLDFISFHRYGVKGYFDEFGIKGLKMNGNADNIANNVTDVLNNIVYPLLGENIEVHVTEWNTSYSSRDPVHDTYQNATYLLNTLKKVDARINSMSYWTFTDVFEEISPALTPFHGGFGLLNLQGIRKPSFYVYNFINRLGKIELINQDEQSWACKDKDGNCQILLWNCKLLDQGGNSNQKFYRRNLAPNDKHTVNLQIDDLPKGEYELRITRVGYKCNDAYTLYYDLGSPEHLSLQQEHFIKDKVNGNPEIIEFFKINNSGIFKYKLNVRENDIYFIELLRI